MLTQEVTRFLVFAFLAVIRTVVIDILGWRLLVSILSGNQSLDRFLEKIRLNIFAFTHIISFVFSNLASYYLNRYITFENRTSGSDTVLLLNFTAVSLFSLVVSVWLINWLTSSLKVLQIIRSIPVFAQQIESHWPMLAKLITIAVVMFCNYFGYMFLVFTT